MNTLFKAIDDATRRRILEILKDRDMSAGEIAEHFEMSKPSISHHLDLLKRAGLIEPERRGQFIYYSINTSVVDDILKWIMSLKSKKK